MNFIKRTIKFMKYFVLRWERLTLGLKLCNNVRLQMILQSLEQVMVGGSRQWILTRGYDQNPILLFLHGGPGSTEIATASCYQQNLEQHFLVINWDQRGAGKSYHSNDPSLSVAQLIADTTELIKLLLEKFNKRKLYVLGHSWGSALGLLVASKHPELVHGYIGVGQLVDGLENERLAFEHVQKLAYRDRNRLAISHLRHSGFPPYNYNVRALLTQRSWLYWFGGFFHDRGKALRYALNFLTSKNYTVWDKLNYSKNLAFSLRQLWPQVEKINLFNDVPSVRVPVLFCLGKYDMTTPSALAQRYFEVLDAPSKHLVWFSQSAHCPNLEEPDIFAKTIWEWLEKLNKDDSL